MYRVELDGETLYDPRLKDYDIFTPKLKLEVNKAGAFDFKVYPSHPLYNRIFKLKSIIEVYQDSTLLFRGRVLDDEMDFNKAKMVICEGELAYFNDSILRPYEFTGSVTDYLKLIINQHNSQVQAARRFTLGNVTVTDPNDYIVRSDSTYPKTWDVVENKLIKSLGGYLMVRREKGVNYIDYLEDSNRKSLQKIELGKNLLDLATQSSASEVYTAILPLGAELKNEDGEETGERLTIESVNGGKDFIQDDEAVQKYGFIMKVGDWTDVTIASNLLRKARQELAQLVRLSLTLELTAVDLSMIDVNIDEFRVFEYVDVLSEPHGVNESLLVEKMELNLTSPANNKITIGRQQKSLTETQIETDKVVGNIQVIKGPKGDKGDPGAKGDDGIAGKDGVGLKSTAIDYALSTSGTAKPVNGWTTSVPSLIKGQYLWTRTVWAYTDNTTETGYSVTYISKDGNSGSDGLPGKDGVGIKTTTIEYANSTNGVTKPTTGWTTTIPSVPNGNYLWTRTTWTYTDNTAETSYSVARMGANGPKGDQGIKGDPGADGKSQYVHIRYSANANGSNMTDTPQSNTVYIGLANTTSPTAPATNASYTWSKFKGEPGQQGSPGIPGAPGTDGQTTYTWVKYADNDKGVGISDNPDGKLYIGLAFNKMTATESNVASDYSWSLMPQNIEIGGRNYLPYSGSFWEAGWYSASGEKAGNSHHYRLKNFIEVDNNQSFYAQSDVRLVIRTVDENGSDLVTHDLKPDRMPYMFNTGKAKRLYVFILEPTAPLPSISKIKDYRIKLEKGNKATDWTPAPEDIQAELDNKADNEYVTEVTTTLNTTIEEAIDGIRTEVEKVYIAKSEFETYQESVSTQFEQTSEQFNFTFNELIEQITKLDDDTQAQFMEIVKYIRFVNGNIILGQVGNELELKIQNNRIQFLQGGAEVAYFSNNKLYVTDGEFINSLKLGNFAFMPRENGSLDFKKVVN
ncbi:phage tail protein [Vagococcus lutrae]|uniref:phage tail spike protein n=1 Tax=Vagococcus lutrae TaxID=81947 RepID=UPI00200E7CE5|nr:phage tail spike protein [Vagococcus lutrae]UQF24206.1 phage tail protein [Vagococcus lutrae]UQF63703.1 phage tail protein [Vagococcus lutrae]